MSLLTVDIGGANQTAVPFARAGHAEPRQVGKRRYAFAGNERSMIRSEPMVVPVLLANLPASTIATLRSLFALGNVVVCEGDVFNNGGLPVYCMGEFSDEVEVGGTYVIGTLTLTETLAATGGRFGLTVAAGGSGSAVVTINAPRRSSIAAGGSASVSVALNRVKAITVLAAGQATTSARTLAQQSTVLAAGSAAASARTTRQQNDTSAAGRATVSITLTKIP